MSLSVINLATASMFPIVHTQKLRYSHHVPLFVIVVLGVVFGVISISNLFGDNGAADLVVDEGVLQGCEPLPILSLPRVVVTNVVSLRPLLLLLAPPILMNPLDIVI